MKPAKAADIARDYRNDAQYDNLRDEARALYDTSDWSNELIAAKLGISIRTFTRLRKLWNWPRRLPFSKRRLLLMPDVDGKSTGINAQFIAQLRRELDAVEKMLAKDPEAIPPAAAAEKRARAIGSLVRSLTEIRRLERSTTGEPADDDFPHTLEELRAELSRRVDQLRNAGGTGDFDEEPDAA